MTAWVSITKPTTDTYVSKANFGDPVIDDLNVLRADACVVKRTSNQTISNDSETSLLFDTDREDSNAMHDTVSNTNRIVITRPGIYLISATYIVFTAHATGIDQINIKNNVGTYLATETRAGNASISNVFNISIPVLFTAANWVEATVLQTSGGNLDITYNISGASPNFSAILLKDLT